jgi:hypothetical protein
MYHIYQLCFPSGCLGRNSYFKNTVTEIRTYAPAILNVILEWLFLHLQVLVKIMKSLPSAEYQAKLRTWSFSLADHDPLVQAVQPMKQVAKHSGACAEAHFDGL